MAALKALKVQAIITSAFPKADKVIHNFNKPFFLVRNNRTLEHNEMVFRAKGNLTKPELTQVLDKLYGIKADKLASWNKMGKIMMTRKAKTYYRKPDFKKFSVKCSMTVPPNLQTLKP
jgi:ribosomal protein L23